MQQLRRARSDVAGLRRCRWSDSDLGCEYAAASDLSSSWGAARCRRETLQLDLVRVQLPIVTTAKHCHVHAIPLYPGAPYSADRVSVADVHQPALTGWC